MPNVTVNLDVTVDASGDLVVFANDPPEIGNTGGATVQIDASTFFKGNDDGLFRFQTRPSANGGNSSLYAERNNAFTGSESALAAAIKSVLSGEFDVSEADPYNNYTNSDYHSVPSFGHLALGSYAYYLFGHVQATAAIDNDISVINKLIGDGTGDAQLNKRLAQAIYALSGDKLVQIVRAVLGQDATRTRKDDSTQAYPDNWQSLIFKPGDTIYVSIRLQPPSVLVSGTGQQSVPSSNLFEPLTYAIKIVLGGTVVEDEPIFYYDSFPQMTQNVTVVNRPVQYANSSGPVNSFSISPTLPAGLSMDASGNITGTPTAYMAATTYTVTGTNSGGNGVFSFTLAVNPQLPEFEYNDPFVFTVGEALDTALTAAQPASNAPATYAVSANHTLPAGLNLNQNTGLISGTPQTATAQANYAIIATNASGSYTYNVDITVNPPKPTIAYPTVSGAQTLVVGTAISYSVLVGGGAANSIAVSPNLPAGLSMDASGNIAGTPTTVTAAGNYVVTATNASGSNTATLNLTVNPRAPSISYTTPNVFTVGTAITALTSTNSGGAVTSYSGSLPAGLSLNGATGEITGTPSAALSATNYSITATNVTGSSVATISIAVNNIAPDIEYPVSSYTYTTGQAITAVTPTNNGANPIVYSVSPTLPAGLNLSTSTGVISGTPSANTLGATYTVTGTTSAGQDVFYLSITVNPPAPIISYASPSYGFDVNNVVDGVIPTNTGGAVVTYTATGLPSGAGINPSTGEIGGRLTTAGSYTTTVTATNLGGSATATITFTVNEVPPTIEYSASSYVLAKGVYLTNPIVPIVSGSITSIVSTPNLPLRLSLNVQTGIITGTPDDLQAETTYTIRATNSAGYTETTVKITVNEIAPEINYASPVTFVSGTLITDQSANNTGGAAIYAVVGNNLPAGLLLNDLTGVISGVPTDASLAAADYVISATNSGGTDTSTINITISPEAPEFSYFSSTLTLNKNTLMTPNTALVTKGAGITFTVANNLTAGVGGVASNYSSTLPAGLDISGTTGLITGTPTTVATARTIYIRGTNVTGSYLASVVITVNDAIPVFTYAPNNISGNPYAFNRLTTNNGVAPVIVSGGTFSIDTTSGRPSLWSGLGFNSGTGKISVSSTANLASLRTPTEFFVKCTNSTGQVTTMSVFLRVNEQIPLFDYNNAGLNGADTFEVANTGAVLATLISKGASQNRTPTVTTSTPVAGSRLFTISPALPGSLVFNSGTGVISGTSGVARSATVYTISLTNTGVSPQVTGYWYVKMTFY